MLQEEEEALQHQLEIIKQKRSQVGSASAATEEEDLQQVVKKKVLTKTAPFSAPPRPVAVVSAEEEAEEELEEELEEEEADEEAEEE